MPTPNLNLIPLEASQSQKHVMVNEAFARLDAAVQLTVIDRTHTAPPPDPNDGDRYLIAAGASDDWALRDVAIAAWDQAALGWHYLTPRAGWHVWIEGEGIMLVYDGTEWTTRASAQWGVNTSADSTNRLAVASDAVLFTHDGADVQAKLNKAAPQDTASLLFQTNYTGHAEIGLSGDNDLHIKTSSNGGTFTDAMVIDATTSWVDFPVGVTCGGVTLDGDLIPNALQDSGRFGGNDGNASITLPSFVAPSYLAGRNGSLITPHARFIHNNTSYGGTAGVLDPEIDGLNAILRPPTGRRFGNEWWAAKITKGAGESFAATAGGVMRTAAMLSPATPMPRAYTVGAYYRALSGSISIGQELTSRFTRWGADETGNSAGGVITPADGWVFIERQMTHNSSGYNQTLFLVYAENEGDEFLVALPRVVFGHVALDPYLIGPLPNTQFAG